MSDLVTEANAFLADFERLERAGAGRTPRWLEEHRREGMRSFLDRGFPTRRDEDWRYTDVAPLKRHRFALAPPAAAVPATLSEQRFALGLRRGARLVFVNGRFVPSLSRADALPRGARLASLAEALAGGDSDLEDGIGALARPAEHPFAALNSAFLADGLFLDLPPGAVVEEPIQAIFLLEAAGSAIAVHPRLYLRLGAGSRATLIERYGVECVGALGAVGGFTNAVLEAVLGDGADLRVVRVQREGGQEHHLGLTAARLGAGARLAQTSLSLGGALCRHETHVAFTGPGAECDLRGLYAIAQSEHSDHHTVVRHEVPDCASRQLYKGILAGHARGAFTGRVVVARAAQRTAARQANHNLLLSRDATAETRPQLEILADDVKCTHGATIGQIDDDALFYLRTRGLGPLAARNLLVHAFAGEITQSVGDERITAGLEALLGARLDADPKRGAVA
jgi:Fe-S cluster assembly protein SufD